MHTFFNKIKMSGMCEILLMNNRHILRNERENKISYCGVQKSKF